MEQDPYEPIADVLFLVGMVASMLILVLPAKPKPPQPTVWCCGGKCGPC